MTPGAEGSAAPSGRAVVQVEFITSAGCHYCGHTREVLERVRSEMPFQLTEIDLESPAGQAALARWRVPFPPMVVMDGALFGYGRISEGKLRAALASKEV